MTDASTARPVLSGRYELHRRIARGGMADVFLARDQLLDRPVAVKVLFPHYAAEPTFVARFRREAQSAANLNYPSIVAVYDWGAHEDTYFIVMEYVEGRSLADVLASEGHLHPDRAAEIATDVAAALGFAHRNGTVHRDVKPGNIMVTPTGQVKVTDFGIARAFGGDDDELTQTGSVMGTASYFSPEQAQGKQVDPRSDLYSLGIVLFEMVTGEPPFVGSSPVAIAKKHVQEPPPLASSLNPAVPAPLDAIIARLLAKNPEQRYPSAEDVRADLRRFREGHPLVGAMAPASPSAGAAPPFAPAPFPATFGGPEVAPTQAMARPPDTGSARAVIDTTRALPASAAVRQYEPVEEYYEPPSRTGVFVVILAGLLLLLIGLIFLILQATRPDDNATTAPTVPQVQVPGVLGEDVNTAVNRLRNEGFETDVRFETSDEGEPNTVFRQEPEPLAEADQFSTVTLFVVQTEETVTVPDVANLTFEVADDRLTRLGFTVSPEREESDTVPIDVVIRQEPEAGEEVNEGSVITIVVSSGATQAQVPALGRLDVPSATAELSRLGFASPVIQEEASSDVPPGLVIRTEPPAGSQVSLQTQITIYRSTGPENVPVPNVVSLTQAAAEQQLISQGFVPLVEFVDVDDGSVQVGTVVSQQPQATQEVPIGTEILIRVGRAVVTTTAPPTTAPPTTPLPTVPPTTAEPDNG